jgi:hypothetical protein
MKDLIDKLGEAEKKYIEEFSALISNWHKFREHVEPFLDNESKELAGSISAELLALPLSHMILNSIHMTNIAMLRDMTMKAIPPLKITCPDCKKVVWDVSELQDFLNPKGVDK